MGMNNLVFSLAFSGNDLYAGGIFTAAGGGIPAHYIAKCNDCTWSALDLGLGGSPSSAVYAVAVSDGRRWDQVRATGCLR
jgi:hypothetical protein